MVKITRKLIGSNRTLWEIKASKRGRSYGVYTNKLKAIKDAKIMLKSGKNVDVFPVKLLTGKGKVTFKY